MNVLVIGANSDIGLALAHLFANRHGAHLTLASRDVERLRVAARDIEIRHQVKVEITGFDILDTDSHQAWYEGLDPRPDLVILAAGALGDQQLGQKDFAEARRILDTNLTGPVSILELAAREFEIKGRGGVIAFASPAGLRGRQSNYLYGAAKGGLIVYLSGLRHRLHAAGVGVLTVLPGFVDTKMTEGLDLPPRLTATPEQVAEDVHKAWRKGRSVVYTRWFWRWIMLVIRLLPEALFVRTKL